MRDFERRNQHFDRMVNTPDLRWLGGGASALPARGVDPRPSLRDIRSRHGVDIPRDTRRGAIVWRSPLGDGHVAAAARRISMQ